MTQERFPRAINFGRRKVRAAPIPEDAGMADLEAGPALNQEEIYGVAAYVSRMGKYWNVKVLTRVGSGVLRRAWEGSFEDKHAAFAAVSEKIAEVEAGRLIALEVAKPEPGAQDEQKIQSSPAPQGREWTPVWVKAKELDAEYEVLPDGTYKTGRPRGLATFTGKESGQIRCRLEAMELTSKAGRAYWAVRTNAALGEMASSKRNFGLSDVYA
jgi:predicted transcriptional regulator